MSTRPTAIADRYRVLDEAGRGGMGAVYRCLDERLGREVALKQVGRSPGESVTDQARALREARSSAALNHPHVVAVYDAVAEGDHVWLVMEHVTGRTLAEIIRQDGPLAPRRAAHLGAQVADGLSAAHRRGTVHRDVKPGNVLVDAEDRARISDFGIARTAGDVTLTRSGMLSGTPAYIAPEVARGGDPGPASDVWALGATLFAAVEGRPPYDHPNAMGLLSAIASEEPPVPEHAGALADPISRMLACDPATRWSMTEARDALRLVHEGAAPAADTREETAGVAAPVPPPVTPAPAPSPVPPRRRRGRGALLVAALVVLLVGAVGALVLVDLRTGEQPGAGDTAGDRAPAPEQSTPTNPPTEDQGGGGSGGQTDDGGTSAPPSPSGTTRPPADTAGGGAQDAGAFVEDYYAALPEDVETGYAMLSPDYRAQTSYGEYEGFWSTVEEVSVEGTEPVEDGVVDVTLLYDGGNQEVRRLYLEEGRDGWLIADDEVVTG